MSLGVRFRSVAICLSVFALLPSFGCKTAEIQAVGQAGTASLSGPPVFNAAFQAREPRKCSRVTGPPSAAQAVALIQCFREKIDAHELWITSNVQAEIGSPRAFLYDTDANWPEIDTNSKIYPLRGSLIGYDCTHIGEVGGVRGKNCMKFVIASAKGACWKTTFGDWKCDEDGNMNPSTADEPPPAPVY